MNFPLQAPQPTHSVLDHATDVLAMPTRQDALQRYLYIPKLIPQAERSAEHVTALFNVTLIVP
jgi:hypothetical protein